MPRNEVYDIERTKWNSLAQQKLPALKTLSFDDNFYQYSQRTSTMQGVYEFLGNLRGKWVLEYGCGLGEISLLLAKNRAKLTSFDISPTSIAVTRQRAEANKVQSNINLVVCAGERLPFASESFDIIFGKAILHHLDVNVGWHSLYHILKPAGKAAFVEPMGMNPLLRFARAHVHYPGKNPRGADRPLNYQEIKAWGQQFSKFKFQEIQLLSMLERGFGFRKNFGLLRKLDAILLKHLPFLRRYCRYVVMLMEK